MSLRRRPARCQRCTATASPDGGGALQLGHNLLRLRSELNCNAHYKSPWTTKAARTAQERAQEGGGAPAHTSRPHRSSSLFVLSRPHNLLATLQRRGPFHYTSFLVMTPVGALSRALAAGVPLKPFLWGRSKAAPCGGRRKRLLRPRDRGRILLLCLLQHPRCSRDTLAAHTRLCTPHVSRRLAASSSPGAGSPPRSR